MRRILILCGLILIGTIANSQNLDDINDLMGNMQFKEAKVEVDKFLANPKKANVADAYYFKGRIYNSLSFDTSFPILERFSLKEDAFEAFKKNQQLDPKEIRLKFENYNSYLFLHSGYVDLGIISFNSEKYELAEKAFKKAIEIENYMLDKKYEYSEKKLSRFDTSLILNIAVCAYRYKNDEVTKEYYQKIVDANLVGDDYKNAYEFIVDYYLKKDDEKGLNEILSKAKIAYPNDDSWIDTEIKFISKKGDRALLFSKYEELIKQYPKNFVLPYNYAVELYNNLYGKDAPNTGDLVMSEKLTALAKQAISIEDKAEISGTILICNHLYNMSADLYNNATVIKSTKPEDIKKKNDMKVLAVKSADECIVYSDLAIKFYESLPARTDIQKANYKIILNYMEDIYTNIKKIPAKSAEYQKKIKIADTL